VIDPLPGEPPADPRDALIREQGALVSDGFIHSCLAKTASLAGDVVRLIRTLIAAAPVARFNGTTLRSGPAGAKKSDWLLYE
jgi:hypothetical protein